ncbi:MAG: hypothetical protein QS2022_6000 [Candidatus Phytoplasma asteris]|uniref:Uncharacterized protein n=1 Tax='Chrysanthemum coronarium' phytoplasma TaxID=1520703 RepID=A0ABQ0J475_9MOLU|nr:hypothetical protein ['Chrysanthemum coronarium' phytoplasma]TKA87809.1 MAG: hypothetical protein PLY_5980 [Periwinkle leaf yellowing phytoplasma]WEX19832.1 MAG: hypothetical protein QS2022_6000 [Candidatus Phytoplasma asteris]GAK74410.1 hypothetical protein OYV_09180 ['Chrysanthemum coronarium' phytoplasma]
MYPQITEIEENEEIKETPKPSPKATPKTNQNNNTQTIKKILIYKKPKIKEK